MAVRYFESLKALSHVCNNAKLRVCNHIKGIIMRTNVSELNMTWKKYEIPSTRSCERKIIETLEGNYRLKHFSLW